MLIDKDTFNAEPLKTTIVIDIQLGGWLVDSHCWIIDPNTVVLGKPEKAVMKCEWCGLMIPQNISADPNFPICDKNPIVDKLYKSTYANVVKTCKREIDQRIELFEKQFSKKMEVKQNG
jgi:hypothetical protein